MIFLFMVLVNSMGSDYVIIIFVSSAKRTGLAEIVIVFGISLICNIKNKGPRMESWETPYLIGSHTRIEFGYVLDTKHGQGKRFFCSLKHLTYLKDPPILLFNRYWGYIAWGKAAGD
jgi:hypothetical protein